MHACVCVCRYMCESPRACVYVRVPVYGHLVCVCVLCVCMCVTKLRSGCSLLENHYLVIGYLFFISTSLIHRSKKLIQQFSKVSCDQNI